LAVRPNLFTSIWHEVRTGGESDRILRAFVALPDPPKSASLAVRRKDTRKLRGENEVANWQQAEGGSGGASGPSIASALSRLRSFPSDRQTRNYTGPEVRLEEMRSYGLLFAPRFPRNPFLENFRYVNASAFVGTDPTGELIPVCLSLGGTARNVTKSPDVCPRLFRGRVARDLQRAIHTAARPWDRRAWRGAPGHSKPRMRQW
jgi:hypothetical protein